MKKLIMTIFFIILSACISKGSEISVPLYGGVNLELVKCPAGAFDFGSPKNEVGREKYKEDYQQILLTKPFYIGKYEVTQLQYTVILGKNPSNFYGGGQSCPVENISWFDARNFCFELNSKFKDLIPEGYEFDLPTEAQWEYACRAGTITSLNNGKNAVVTDEYYDTLLDNYIDKLDIEVVFDKCDEEVKNIDSATDEVAWFGSNSKDKTHPVGGKKPNAWGIYDMHGNVEEWCIDWVSSNNIFGAFHENKLLIDPCFRSYEEYDIVAVRGGCFSSFPTSCRSSSRSYRTKKYKSYNLGFRVALVPVK